MVDQNKFKNNESEKYYTVQIYHIYALICQHVLFVDIAVFDNTYSRFRSKQLHYSVELHTTDDAIAAEVDEVTLKHTM